VEASVNMKFLGLQIDNHLNWTNHVAKLISEFIGACYVFGCIFCVSKSDTMKLVYFAYFHSILKNGIILGGGGVNLSNSKKLFILQNKTVKLVAVDKPRN
jgi:hypothetical protein